MLRVVVLGAAAGGLAGCCAAAPYVNTPRKAPASKRLRGTDEQILIMFSRLWKPSILARPNPAVPADFVHSLEDFCAFAQSETSAKPAGCAQAMRE